VPSILYNHDHSTSLYKEVFRGGHSKVDFKLVSKPTLAGSRGEYEHQARHKHLVRLNVANISHSTSSPKKSQTNQVITNLSSRRARRLLPAALPNIPFWRTPCLIQADCGEHKVPSWHCQRKQQTNQKTCCFPWSACALEPWCGSICGT